MIRISCTCPLPAGIGLDAHHGEVCSACKGFGVLGEVEVQDAGCHGGGGPCWIPWAQHPRRKPYNLPFVRRKGTCVGHRVRRETWGPSRLMSWKVEVRGVASSEASQPGSLLSTSPPVSAVVGSCAPNLPRNAKLLST